MNQYQVLHRDSQGDDWENSSIIEAIDAECAAEKYAKKYIDDGEGNWESGESIEVEVGSFQFAPIKRFSIELYYEPSFFITAEVEDEE